MPLIMDIKNPAIKERHWKQVKYEVRGNFDENSPAFTLEKVFELGLNQHAEFISDLASNAVKELKIEEQLNEISYTWEEDPKTDLILQEKKGYYIVKTAENIYGVIEEHVVKLSNHKSSAFYVHFCDQIDMWEFNLAKISETLEMLVMVQSKWGYLESIFTSQQDIMRQLANEHSIFQRINQSFKTEMERVHKERNALRALTHRGFLDLLTELNFKLEGIQKNLNQYLETKRSSFPRFYFLSNDDLLEIIGQAKDPRPFQKHIKKVFEGVHSLEIPEPAGRAKNYSITALKSNDGEVVRLTQEVSQSKVEDWFNELLKAMVESMKKLFHKTLTGQKVKVENRDRLIKYISENLGQILITVGQVQWTHDIHNALNQVETTNNPAKLKSVKSAYKRRVESFIEYVKSPTLKRLDREKLIAMITIEEHNREIAEQLFKKEVSSNKHFDWKQQLRFRRDETESNNTDSAIIKVDQTDFEFDYGYEYQGNNGRLVVTPLTDRAYMTMTTAHKMCRGAAPQGPAGTGKTETVKDLGKNLAYFVVVQNCSDQLDYIALGKMFCGLARSGAWGCFDEFNRIELEVLSVVAQ